MSEVELTQELPEVEEQQDLQTSPKKLVVEEETLMEIKKARGTHFSFMMIIKNAIQINKMAQSLWM